MIAEEDSSIAVQMAMQMLWACREYISNAKGLKKLNLYDAMAQSKADARENEMPVVMHRKNNCGLACNYEP